MELTLIAVFGVISIVAVAVVSRRIGVAAPLALVVVGIVLSFLPGVPHIEVEPELVLTVVLPPLLYASAVHMSAIDFRRDLKAILRLAVLLVVATTLCAGYLFSWLLPGLGLAAAFALGAIISPTDAVAATSIGKRLGLPSRLMTILEGEGLVNDATSLVLLGSAVAAMTSTVHLWKVGVDFVLSVLIATVVGVLVGLLTVLVRGRLADAVLNTALSFVVPFLAFLPAEAMGASGVLAVVTTGLVSGHLSPRFLRARDRLAEEVNWQTVAFLLESGIFLLMGLQLRTLVDQAQDAGQGIAHAVGIGLLASLLAIAVRILFLGPLVASLRRDADRAESFRTALDDLADRLSTGQELPHRFKKTDPKRLEGRLRRGRSDAEFRINETFGWRGGMVIAWSGMRGAITVAAAQTLPTDTPYRPQLLLIAFVVAVTTLLLQGLTLPRVIRALRIPGDDAAADRAAFIDLSSELAARVTDALADPGLTTADGAPYDPAILDQVRTWTATRRQPPAPAGTVAEGVDPREQYRDLILAAANAKQDELLSIRSTGAYNSRVLAQAQAMIDNELARFQEPEG
ncbi:cation:proton antiporter [Streptacidiphilus sp. N1-12]|uniref:Cation:proton antiporter n=2 Tax=Streptacidiphilus alkalitolerans TaxID=3342712 RepID=A0ABV6WHK9_9ACTN